MKKDKGSKATKWATPELGKKYVFASLPKGIKPWKGSVPLKKWDENTIKIHNRPQWKLKTLVLTKNLYHSIFFCNYWDVKVDRQGTEFNVIKLCSINVSLHPRLVWSWASFGSGHCMCESGKHSPKGSFVSVLPEATSHLHLAPPPYTHPPRLDYLGLFLSLPLYSYLLSACLLSAQHCDKPRTCKNEQGLWVTQNNMEMNTLFRSSYKDCIGVIVNAKELRECTTWAQSSLVGQGN